MKRSYGSITSFLDLLFNLLLGFIFLFIMAFLLMAPVKKKADITTKAEYIITLTWDANSKDDIDLWIQDPLGEIIFFREKEKGFTHLDRDDLGAYNDTLIMPNGTKVILKLNQELGTIRGFIPGEWVINIHMYKKRDDIPTEVEVVIQKINPIVTRIVYKKYTMETHWEEITVARLTMAANGEIIGMEDELPKSLVAEKLDMTDIAVIEGDVL